MKMKQNESFIPDFSCNENQTCAPLLNNRIAVVMCFEQLRNKTEKKFGIAREF